MVEAVPETSQTSDAPWIGIDLGTTFSAVGVWKNGSFETLQSKDSSHTTTPSVVSYDTKKGDKIHVGEPAV